jgi:ubiquinone/menaquinone biosynthesis C-methylase UbiE
VKRQPEPELMDSEAQTLAYAKADFNESNALFVDHFLGRFSDLAETGRMADLGCGPGDITLRFARALPGWEILGLDAGPNMLKLAEERLSAEANLRHVTFRLSYLPDPELPARAFDALVSNSLLHHLPEPQTLWESIAHLGASGAVVQVMDLIRPDSEAQAQRLVDDYAGDEPQILREDFYNSLLAAYSLAEINEQLTLSGLTHLKTAMASNRHWVVNGKMPG